MGTTIESHVDHSILTIGGQDFSCQPTSCLISSEYQEAGQGVPVICGDELPAAVGSVTRKLKITSIQDFTNPAGLMRYLREHELSTVDFSWLSNPEGETASGQLQCRLGDWGGEAKKRITTELDLPIVNVVWRDPVKPAEATAGKPGTFGPPGAYIPRNLAAMEGITAKPATAWKTDEHVVLRDKSTAWWNGSGWMGGKAPAPAATGATAGKPGTWTPAGAKAPANLAAMPGITADPTTKWTVGQHMILGDNAHAHWDATAWVTGDAPAFFSGDDAAAEADPA